jgi:hypothetical protein
MKIFTVAEVPEELGSSMAATPTRFRYRASRLSFSGSRRRGRHANGKSRRIDQSRSAARFYNPSRVDTEGRAMKLITFNLVWAALMVAVIAFNIHYIWYHYR